MKIKYNPNAIIVLKLKNGDLVCGFVSDTKDAKRQSNTGVCVCQVKGSNGTFYSHSDISWHRHF